MEDKLKRFIDSHIHEFNDESLPQGHFERFEKKLKGRSNRRIRIVSLIAASVAAACVALMLIYKQPAGFTGSNTALHTCGLQQEVEGLQLYYHMQMNGIIIEMEELYDQTPSAGTEEMLKESRKIQAESTRFDEEVLPELPCTEEVLFITNQHYRNSLCSMQNLLAHATQMTETTNIN
jgi:hypothetical protein